MNLRLYLSNLVWHHHTKSNFLLFILQACFSWTGHHTEPATPPPPPLQTAKKKTKVKAQANKTWSRLLPWWHPPIQRRRQRWLCTAFLLVQFRRWTVLKSSQLSLGECGTVLGQEWSGLPAARWRQGGGLLANYNRKMEEFVALSQGPVLRNVSPLATCEALGKAAEFCSSPSAWARGIPQVLVDLGWMNSLGFLINSCKNHNFERSAAIQTLLDYCSRRQ